MKKIQDKVNRNFIKNIKKEEKKEKKYKKDNIDLKNKKEKNKVKNKEGIKILASNWNKFNGIGIKILASFFIPIILMAILGIVSFQKSSNAIISSYVKSSQDTLNAVSNYLQLGFSTVEQTALELSLSDNLENYYNRRFKNDFIEDNSLLRNLKKEIMVSETTTPFISNIYTFSVEGESTTTSNTIPIDTYDIFIKSEEGKEILNSSQKKLWVGNHKSLDELSKISNEKYAISIIKPMNSKKGYIVIDVSKKEIIDVLSQSDFGKGSIFGIITSDGREILTNGEESVFTNLPYYQESMVNKETSGYSYERYNKKEYLYIYSKLNDTGVTMCVMIPKSSIISQAKDIKILNVVFVSIASILAIIVGSLLATGISGTVTSLVHSISLAAKGDLTIKFETKRKDEFNILSKSLTDMLKGMRNLITEVAEVGSKVNESSSTLSLGSKDIFEATKDISTTIDEIEKGVVQQATDTDLCLDQMSSLSEKINQVYSSTYEIEQIANDTKSIIDDGIVIVDELNDKTKATSNITNVVINEIEDLEVHSHKIGDFVKVINEIASQTNLLSLNASIEAARAGESGLGFAVVADEIRKLADQSVKAASEIQIIVTEINNKTKDTVVSAKQAESIVDTQVDALNRTVKAFEQINKHVGNLVNNLDNISVGVKGIEMAKEDTLDAIRNISSVSQQTAAASEEVSATANNQITSVDKLSQSAVELANDAKKLEEAIQLFTI